MLSHLGCLWTLRRLLLTVSKQVWPATQVKCCFFHLTQNIWRKVHAEGLQAAYNQDEELALCIRLLPALAFASPFDVLEVFGDVVQELPMPQATGLVLYFEKTYIGANSLVVPTRIQKEMHSTYSVERSMLNIFVSTFYPSSNYSQDRELFIQKYIYLTFLHCHHDAITMMVV